MNVTGKWDCPWHHCDVCGKGATKLCTECPNSFCNNHIDDNIFDIGDGKLVCVDHEDLLSVITTSRSDAKPKVDPNDEKSSSSGSDTSDESETSPSHSDSEMSVTGQSKETDSESALKKSMQATQSGSVTNGSVKSTPCPSDTESDQPPVKRKRQSKGKVSPHHSDAESISSVGQLSIADDKVSVQSEKSSASEVRSEKSEASSKSSTSRARSKQKKDSKESSSEMSSPNPVTASKGGCGKKAISRIPQDKGSAKTASKGGKKGSVTKSKKKAAESETKSAGDPLVLPMFDDKDDDFPDLVIDIPAF